MTLRNILLISLTFASAAAYAATGSGAIKVSVKEQGSGKVLYQGATDGGGNFKTSNLPPGAYTIEFRPDAKDTAANQLTVALGGIKGPAKQSAISGGLAVNVEVSPASRISGKGTTSHGAATAQSNERRPREFASDRAASGVEKVKANVKVVNGKRYVWVPAEIGSNMGGKWVEEGTEGARVRKGGKDDAESLRRMQDMSGVGSPGGN